MIIAKLVAGWKADHPAMLREMRLVPGARRREINSIGVGLH